MKTITLLDMYFTKTESIDFCVESIDNENVFDLLNSFYEEEHYKYALNRKIQAFDPNQCKVCYYGAYEKESNTLIGYFHGYLPNECTLWIQTFIILPDYTRQKIGTAFFQKVTKQLQLINPLTTIYLACYDANVSGRLFWESLNFRNVTGTYKMNHSTSEINHITIYKMVL